MGKQVTLAFAFLLSLAFLAGCGKTKKKLPRYHKEQIETIIRYDDRELTKKLS